MSHLTRCNKVGCAIIEDVGKAQGWLTVRSHGEETYRVLYPELHLCVRHSKDFMDWINQEVKKE